MENVLESIREIRSAIISGLTHKQRTIGFHTSAASIDMLEIYLHKEGLLPEDSILKHDWFLSKYKIEEKLPFDFPRKNEILGLIREVESKRNNFCYGKRKSHEELSSIVEKFNDLKSIFEGLGISFEEDHDEKE
jgi:hypothetical protein